MFVFVKYALYISRKLEFMKKVLIRLSEAFKDIDSIEFKIKGYWCNY